MEACYSWKSQTIILMNSVAWFPWMWWILKLSLGTWHSIWKELFVHYNNNDGIFDFRAVIYWKMRLTIYSDCVWCWKECKKNEISCTLEKRMRCKLINKYFKWKLFALWELIHVINVLKDCSNNWCGNVDFVLCLFCLFCWRKCFFIHPLDHGNVCIFTVVVLKVVWHGCITSWGSWKEIIYRVAQKSRNGILQAHRDIFWLVSVDGLSSPDKHDTKTRSILVKWFSFKSTLCQPRSGCKMVPKHVRTFTHNNIRNNRLLQHYKVALKAQYRLSLYHLKL